MLSTVVVREQKLGNALRASLTQHEDALHEGLRERLGLLVGEDGESEVLQSLERLYRFFSDLLDSRESAMVASHEAHSAELRDDEETRERRALAAADLYQTLVAIRRAANGHFGSELATRLLDLDGSTSQDPLTLLRQASRVMERLRNPELVLPVSLLGQVPDREGWASRLEPALAELKAWIEAVEAEDRDRSLTKAEKNLSLLEHRRDASAIIQAIQGFLRLAGRRDLALEVRPARLRRRVRQTAEQESPGTAGDPPAGDAPRSPSTPLPGSETTPSTGPPEGKPAPAGV